MTAATLTIDLNAVKENWRSLDAMSAPEVETAAVVKANGYGLDAAKVAIALAHTGAASFFVAVAEEGVKVRNALGGQAKIYVFSGHMNGDTSLLKSHGLIPLLNSAEQFSHHVKQLPDHTFGIQLDSGMNRLGMEAQEFADIRPRLMEGNPQLIISHLACADEPPHPQNQEQLINFGRMTEGLDVRRSLAATGGTLMGQNYHFDLCRPGVGLYGGLPFSGARQVVRLSIPTIQVRRVEAAETVGYSATWTAQRTSKIVTLAAGYADGLIRAMGAGAQVWAGDIPCPVVGRVSMDLLTVDVTDLDEVPESFDILGPHQTVDQLAEAAGTIGYEILTSLGGRYERVYIGH